MESLAISESRFPQLCYTKIIQKRTYF